MLDSFSKRGFLPTADPSIRFERYPELEVLSEWGRELPDLLEDKKIARRYLRSLNIPEWPLGSLHEQDVPELRLYYVHLGFIASGYINQVGVADCHLLPANIAIPLVKACQLLRRRPILSYDGYALYNWFRIDPLKPIALGNINTFQNFVNLYDEHWFILVHVEIEALAAKALSAISDVLDQFNRSNRVRSDTEDVVNQAMKEIYLSIKAQTVVLRRIPERMSSELYYSHFRPYIRFFENVVYEGVNIKPMNYRGETGAQSSIMPTLVAFMKIQHAPSELINHLQDMRHYMPQNHQRWIDQVEQLPDLKSWSDPSSFNAVLEAMAEFRDIHYQWAEEYINTKIADPRGTGGTPYMQWLKQLIDETLANKVH